MNLFTPQELQDLCRLSRLTEKELLIVRLTCEGWKQTRIGKELHVRKGMIRVHMHRIYPKLGIAGGRGSRKMQAELVTRYGKYAPWIKAGNLASLDNPCVPTILPEDDRTPFEPPAPDAIDRGVWILESQLAPDAVSEESQAAERADPPRMIAPGVIGNEAGGFVPPANQPDLPGGEPGSPAFPDPPDDPIGWKWADRMVGMLAGNIPALLFLGLMVWMIATLADDRMAHLTWDATGGPVRLLQWAEPRVMNLPLVQWINGFHP